jgi:predicted NACHT family NTPase
MKTDCPYGRMKMLVTIIDGICDAPDLCRHEKCEYFDTSKEATRLFQKALAYDQTLEGQLKKLLH